MNEILRRIQNLPEDRKARIVELFNKYDPATPGVDEYVSGQCIHNKAHLANHSPVKVVRYAKYEAAMQRIAALEDELNRVKTMLAATPEAKS